MRRRHWVEPYSDWSAENSGGLSKQKRLFWDEIKSAGSSSFRVHLKFDSDKFSSLREQTSGQVDERRIRELPHHVFLWTSDLVGKKFRRRRQEIEPSQ